MLSNFSEQAFCRAPPVSCFSNLLKSCGWMTATYFFFWHLRVFWVFCTSVRVTLELRRKTLRWRLQTRLFFCLRWKKYFIVWWGSIIEKAFDSINEFLENRDQNSLDTRSFSAIFHLVPEVDNCVHNYKTWDVNKGNLKEFPYRTVTFKYSLLPFCVSESNSSENSMRRAKSIKHSKSMLMQFFTLFLWCFQCMT